MDTVKLDVIRAQNYECTRCSNREKTSQVVVGSGAVNPKIVVIVDQPTQADTKCGKPLSGRDGELVKQMLLSANVDLSQVYYTTLLKCPGISKKSINACTSWLITELTITSPQMTIYMGKHITNIMFNNKYNTTPVFFTRKGDTISLPHPTWLLNNSSYISQAKRLIQEVVSELL